jgi:hypothetical protein
VNRNTTTDVLRFYVEGWHVPVAPTRAVQFLIADLIAFYMMNVDRDPVPMLNTARAMADANLETTPK